MGNNEKSKPLRPKEYYRERIIEMVKDIKNSEILQYIYIIVSDIEREDKKNDS